MEQPQDRHPNRPDPAQQVPSCWGGPPVGDTPDNRPQAQGQTPDQGRDRRAGASARPLLQQDSLIIQQTRGFMKNDMDIEDAAGTVVGRVVTRGGGLRRAFMGARELDIVDAAGGTVVHVEDQVNFWRDRFRLFDGGGAQLAEVVSRVWTLGTKVDMELAGGHEMRLSGNPLGLDFDFEVDGVPSAFVGRRWGGMGRALLGHSRYRLEFDPGLPEWLRAATLGGVVVLDLLRAKRSRES